ncbi:MAG TPA: HXXEE domain-containing protein [Vicinamibacteria bacterium]|nr:HXXEE domain-containing protein [Vicinamibacteria bacterium]
MGGGHLSRRLFLALILSQAAHSIEEYVFRLYDVFAPARFVSGLVSGNLAVGFAVVNAAVVLLGLWCYRARIRRPHPSGRSWAWFWTVLEGANGTGHLILAAAEGGYFPGVATAPLLLGFSIALGATLLRGDVRTPV